MSRVCKDITNKKIGNLIAIKKTQVKSENGSYKWEFKCTCGKIIIDTPSRLVQQLKKYKDVSCGCISHAKRRKAINNLGIYIDGTCIINLNKKIYSTNTSGARGVFKEKNKRRWRAVIQFKNKKIYLGTFDTKEDAVSAREKAEEEIWNTFIEEQIKTKGV